MSTPIVSTTRATWLVLLCLALYSARASAAIDSNDILETVLQRFANATSIWAAIITRRASWLFWTLATISMVWTFGMMALRRADVGEFFAEFFRFTMFTGFFWWLLLNGPGFATDIMKSLRQVAAEASGLPNALAPSGILDIGFDIFAKVVDQSSVWSPADSIIGLLISAIILVVFALVATNMLLLLISGWFLAFAGVFVLGFGGSRWTSELAIGYFKSILSIALQLFAMVLLVGVGKTFVDQYYAGMGEAVRLKELGIMLVVAIVLLLLVAKIPAQIGSLAGGNIHALGSGFGAGAAVGAAAMGVAALGTAGTALMAGAANMGGGAQALMAAFSKANADGAGDAARSLGASALGSSNGNTGAQGVNAAGGNGSPLAEAMGGTAGGTSGNALLDTGTRGAFGSMPQSRSGSPSSTSGSGSPAARAGKVAFSTIGNLAQGSMDVAKAKVTGLNDSVLERIRNTTGGKIAAAIQARESPAPVSNQATFGQDSLTPVSEQAGVDAEAEIAAFRDRTPEARS